MLKFVRPTRFGAAIIAATAMLIATLSQSYAETGGRVALQNANGVVIKVRGPAIGLEAALSLSGMTISMQ